jgi:hypothetical protein
MTREQLGEVLGVSQKSCKAGPCYGAIKELVESCLVADRGGVLERKEKELA